MNNLIHPEYAGENSEVLIDRARRLRAEYMAALLRRFWNRILAVYRSGQVPRVHLAPAKRTAKLIS